MKSRTTFVSSIAALALSAVIAIPALAGSPTYSGDLTCTANGQLDYPVETLDGATKKYIAERKKFWGGNNVFCDKGTVDLSQLTKDA